MSAVRAFIQRVAGRLVRLSCVGQRTGAPFSRFAMYERIKTAFLGIRLEGEVLSISHSRHLAELIGLGGLPCQEANFPEASLLDLPYEDGRFALVVSDQVLEHVHGNPQRAIDESLRVAKVGGYVLHTTCFNVGYHGPGDYWRFTPEGLGYLCRNSAEVVQAGTCGHPLIQLGGYLGLTWTPVPLSRWHPLHRWAMCDWPSHGQHVWVIARK
jgi:SAM-dependent methyltransferase